MGSAIVHRYSEAFKLQVVQELESGELRSLSEASRRYAITGTNTVRHWVQKYGKADQLPRVIRVEKPNEPDRLKALQEENDRLKKALADSHLKAVLYETWLNVSLEELGVTDPDAFKKKLGKRP